MIPDKDIVKLIFGLKIKYLRQKENLSYQQLHDKTGIGLSYLHEIEKGKKYPKADKIFALCAALGVEYDELVSLKSSKRLRPMIDLLNSEFMKIFPFETFGIDAGKLMELFFQTPDKVNAFVSSMIKMVRSYQISKSHFYQVALRSYQDLHDNYFPELEEAVRAFKSTHDIGTSATYTPEYLSSLLKNAYGIQVDRSSLAAQAHLSNIRSYFNPKKKTLHLNEGLSRPQENFLLGRELACQYLDLPERPFETRLLQAESFEGLLSNFKASYFSVALLMEEQALARDMKRFFRQNQWDASGLLDLLTQYEGTPEMFFQRLTNILPKHLGLQDLFFIRLHAQPDLTYFSLTKELHLSQLHGPYANQREEKYCRRWLSLHILKLLRMKKLSPGTPLVAAQISRFWNSPNEYLVISMAKEDGQTPKESVSVTLALQINDQLRKWVHFLHDPALKTRVVNTTCERCAIPDCNERAAPPIRIEEQEAIEEMKQSLQHL